MFNRRKEVGLFMHTMISSWKTKVQKHDVTRNTNNNCYVKVVGLWMIFSLYSQNIVMPCWVLSKGEIWKFKKHSSSIWFHIPSPSSSCLPTLTHQDHFDLPSATGILNNPYEAPNKKKKLPIRQLLTEASSFMTQRPFQLDAGKQICSQQHCPALPN